MLRVAAVCLAVAVVLTPNSLFAQTPTVTAVGSVQDSAWAVVPGATIETRRLETNVLHSAKSHAESEFTIPNLPPGPYEATITHDGSRVLKEIGIECPVSFKLQLRTASETITVTASATFVNTEIAERRLR